MTFLAGTDAEAEETGERALKVGKLPNPKVKMGWHKVPCSNFDYAPASLNPVLVQLGVKEKESLKLPLAHALHLERDTRTMSLVTSFLDMRVCSKQGSGGSLTEPRAFQGSQGCQG